MPQKLLPKCIQCEKTDTLLWHNIENGVICNECHDKQIKTEIEPTENENSNNGDEKKTRKSTRSTRYKTKNNTTNTAITNKGILKGRSRRCIFKKTPFKALSVPATTHTVQHLFYKDSYIQVGDIVSLMDTKDNVYYAQIRGLLVDTYCEKSAFITWLIPTQASPPPNEKFDPSTYLIGPDEDSPRKLSCMEFVMHAPSNYYHDKTQPFPPPDFMDHQSNSTGFIWTRLTTQNKEKN